jgi:hypothetical protein
MGKANAVCPPGHPTITPGKHRQRNGIQIEALVGKSVLVARWSLAIDFFPQDFVLDETLEPIGKDIRRDAQMLLEIVEVLDTIEALTDDQDAPAIPDHLKCDRNRARARTLQELGRWNSASAYGIRR